MVKIAIDSGHGLYTSGKEVPGYIGVGRIKEWTLNDKITKEMIRLLNDYANVSVLRLDDPSGRRDVPLSERARKANNWKADILISNHHNAGIGGRAGGGLVIYRFPNSRNFTHAMNRALYNEIIAQTGLKGNRSTPVSSANFAILRQSHMAAVLIEHGFMDSPSDMKVVMQPDFATKSARGVVNWLVKHYNLKRKSGSSSSTPSPTPTPSPSKDYLSKNDKGKEVEELQESLVKLGYNLGSYGADGVYGNDTVAAVRRYQSMNNLKVDGIAGKETIEHIKSRFKKEEVKVDRPGNDSPSNWAKESWERMTRQGIVDGSNPKGAASREMVAKMIDTIMFNEEQSEWSKEDVAKAVEKGITDSSNLGGLAKREQVIAMIMRALEEVK